MRADWQTNYQHTRSNDDDEFSGDETQKKWEWSGYYPRRALPSLKAKLALGGDYLRSDIFDGFNYVGGSVSTDNQMLPPNLRGYAPDISGVAHHSKSDRQPDGACDLRNAGSGWTVSYSGSW